MLRKTVPNLWLEDALADVRVALWRQPDRNDVMVISAAAVDCARRYGRFSRSGRDRQTLSIDALQETGFDVPTPSPTILLDEKRALNALTKKERDLFTRSLSGERLGNSQQQLLSIARQVLHRVLAGELTAPDQAMAYRRTCYCGVIFWASARAHGKRWCTPRCRTKYACRREHWGGVRRLCAYCAKPLVYQRGAAHTRKRFCGTYCYNLQMRGRKITDYDKSCEWCHAPFKAKRVDRRFCSTICVRAVFRARHSRWQGVRLCAACHAPFESVQPRAKYCTRRCQGRIGQRRRRAEVALAA